MATKFKHYGYPKEDLIQEAALGLMKAAEKFDPDLKFRFATYAKYWVKAVLNDYVMRNLSIVSIGKSSSQKSLFFNFRREQLRLERKATTSGESIEPHQLRKMISDNVGVPLEVVEMMEGRLVGSDFSLNVSQSTDQEGLEWIDSLEDEGVQGAELVEKDKDMETLRKWLVTVMANLNDREQFIVRERKLRNQAQTLESLGNVLGVSKERVRQLELVALRKMRKSLKHDHPEVLGLLG